MQQSPFTEMPFKHWCSSEGLSPSTTTTGGARLRVSHISSRREISRKPMPTLVAVPLRRSLSGGLAVQENRTRRESYMKHASRPPQRTECHALTCARTGSGRQSPICRSFYPIILGQGPPFLPYRRSSSAKRTCGTALKSNTTDELRNETET